MVDPSAASQPPRPPVHRCDVLVIGGGPSGSAAAYWLATRGVDVLVLEKKVFPREKTCGDGLTPRSVTQLRDMGLENALAGQHRYDGLRAVGFGTELEMRWPPHKRYPDYGYTITRFDLDSLVARHAEKAGAVLWQGAEAVAPLERSTPGSSDLGAESAVQASDGGAVAGRAGGAVAGRAGGAVAGRAGGATVLDRERGTYSEVRARYTLVADGSLSRFGRTLGAERCKVWPQGMALRGYFSSPRHDDAYIESHLDIRDEAG
ncbi:MAG: FAD-dependent oxidoreductase, partial [Acidimicrobiales bacterium]